MLCTVWSWGFIHKGNLFKVELVPSMVIKMVWRMESSFYEGRQKLACFLTQEKQPVEEVMVVINRYTGDISMKEDETM